MRIQTKELVISEKLKRKAEMICRFAYIQKNMNMMAEILIFKKNELQLAVKDHFVEMLTHYAIGRANNGVKKKNSFFKHFKYNFSKA